MEKDITIQEAEDHKRYLEKCIKNIDGATDATKERYGYNLTRERERLNNQLNAVTDFLNSNRLSNIKEY